MNFIQRSLCLLVLVCLIISGANAGKKNKNDCSDWVRQPCRPKRNNCGPGFQEASRSGSCKGPTQRRFKCTVACPYNNAANTTDVHSTTSLEAVESEVVGDRTQSKKVNRWRQSRPSLTETLHKRRNRKSKQWKNKVKDKLKCRYTRVAEGTCDPILKVIVEKLTLKNGNPQQCQELKNITRPCKGCKYERDKNSSNSDCNPLTNTQEVSLILKSGNNETCAQTLVVARNCKIRRAKIPIKKKNKGRSKKEKRNSRKKGRKNKRCNYDKGSWSECDRNDEKHRTDTRTDDSHASCVAKKTLVKKCRNTEKKEGKCIFGKWGDFGTCQNGVKTKKREVIQGGEKCQRRAVKIRRCKN